LWAGGDGMYKQNGSFNSFQNADMMNFLLTPAAIKGEAYNKCSPTTTTTTTATTIRASETMQTKQIPQKVDDNSSSSGSSSKETFNDKTRKSLLKLNLFIKRLKLFNIFTHESSQQQSMNGNKDMQKW